MAVILYTAFVFTIVVAVTNVAAQIGAPSTTTEAVLIWNKACDNALAACTVTYLTNVRNKETTMQYRECVYKVPCERWSPGYYNRQDMLAEIQARREHYDPHGAEWWNGASTCEGSLKILAISLLSLLYSLFC